MNYYLKFHTVEERAFVDPVLLLQTVRITAYSLHEAWSQAIDYLEIQRKFTPVVFVSLDCPHTTNSKTATEVSDCILPKTL